MIRRFSVNFSLLAMVLDALGVGLALALAAEVRPWLSGLPFAQPLTGEAGLLVPWLLYPIFAGAFVVGLALFGLYDGRRLVRGADEFAALGLGGGLAWLASAGLLYLSVREVSRLLFLSFGWLAMLILVSWRVAHRLARRIGKPDAPRVVLVVGGGALADALVAQLTAHSLYGVRLAGRLDNPDGLRDAVLAENVTDVILAVPRAEDESLDAAVWALHDLPLQVWVAPDYFALAVHRAVVEEFAGIPLLDLRAPALGEGQRRVKRAFDLALALICLPLALPLMGLLAVLIRASDGGPALYIPERVGENGRVFRMLKFRTMSPDTEAGGTEEFRFKTPDDPRITRLGRMLRRTSLDELPQLFNILRGDMSWVGPRPEQPHLVARYERWQRQRFAVPQGLTGWWQVNGRSDRPMHENTEYDLYYVRNVSLGLDIHILVRTIWAVLAGKGAY